MRIDFPLCSFKHCRYCFDGNCTKETEYARCEYRTLAELRNSIGEDCDFDRLRELLKMRDRLESTQIKIGDHVFDISDGNIGEWEVIGILFGIPYLKVFEKCNYQNEVFVIAKEITVDEGMLFQFTLSEIGEKVFLSQKEAESALEKMKERDK